MKLTSFFGLVFAGLATALPAPDFDNVADDIIISTMAHSDVTVPKLTVPPGATIVTPNSPFRALDPSRVDSIILCVTASCTNCYAFTLSTLAKNSCYTTSIAFSSGFLYTSSNGTPANVYVSTTINIKCGNAYSLPVNTCGYLPDGPQGNAFFIL
ncbi:hypothetical protein CPB83DRAFT_832002 [Crepidotus variabilis]|uniref:Uncharacterized protein n=1 Tax=Crepidotus variabilis TaxID=179855 RepID=A0A9P6JTV2_9AGAR|nr:hypothetical protein CPB83DRAFT_832002 [Crepidotus variabilis]